MLATLADPTKVPLPTNTTTRGHIQQHITTLKLKVHTMSILGRTFAQLLIDPGITHLKTNPPSLQYNETKGLTCMLNDMMAWATTRLAHTDVLQAYEEGL